LTKQGLETKRCILCGKYPELCYRYVKRNGIFSALWCISKDKEIEHEIRLVGTSVEGLVAAWGERSIYGNRAERTNASPSL